MCEGPSKPIIRDITLEEGVLYIKPDYVINIHTIKDSGKGVISYDLIAYHI
jgi:hypothetical protein